MIAEDALDGLSDLVLQIFKRNYSGLLMIRFLLPTKWILTTIYELSASRWTFSIVCLNLAVENSSRMSVLLIFLGYDR